MLFRIALLVTMEVGLCGPPAGTTTSHTGKTTKGSDCIEGYWWWSQARTNMGCVRIFLPTCRRQSINQKNTENSRDEERMGSNGKKMQDGAPFFSSFKNRQLEKNWNDLAFFWTAA